MSLEGISWELNQGPDLIGTVCLGATSSDWTSPFDCESGTPQTFGASAPTAKEDSAGIVHLAGGFNSNIPSSSVPVGDAVTSLAFPLVPLSFAPSWNVFEIVHTNFGTYADVEIATDGTIRVIPPRSPAVADFGYLSLDGVTFAAASPKFFGLAARGKEKQGATVTVMLHKPRVLALQVRTLRRHRLVTLGVVHLGRHPAGRSQLHWNLRVSRRLLPPGRYQISLHAVNGNILSVPAPPGARTLVVLPNKHVRVGT